jgi:hypothetical protein
MCLLIAFSTEICVTFRTLNCFFSGGKTYYYGTFWVWTPAEVGVVLDGDVLREDLVFLVYGVTYVEFYSLGGERLGAVRTLEDLDTEVDDLLFEVFAHAGNTDLVEVLVYVDHVDFVEILVTYGAGY